jgi:hypothetical protein
MPPPDTPSRITLPTDLSGSLKSLDDAQLQRLSEAVGVEIDRRARAATQNEPAARAGQNQAAAKRSKRIKGPDEIPAGRVNLIQASFKAGLKPRPSPAPCEYPSLLCARFWALPTITS